ncbi:unnamed protein product, partial [Larinioides sclopetarius]
MQTTVLNIPVGFRQSIQPMFRGYQPVVNDEEESSSRLIKWIIGLCVVPTCIAMSGMIAIGIGYSNTGFAMVFSAIIGYVLFAIVESLNWKKYCGYLRKMCSCRGAEIHTPEQPSPSQPLLQPPTLQVPVPEPPTLQVPVPEPPT